MYVLGVETSCDETSAAVVAEGPQVLSNVVASQADLHARWGGVVPEVASRKHVERFWPVVREALDAAGISLRDVTGIAVTNRPGLIGALAVGVAGAKALGYALRVPVVGVHHLLAHLDAAFLCNPDLRYPFLGLLVSGGHTQLILCEDAETRRIIGSTRDDAAGECLDKCARVLGLPYPGGPHIERLASRGDSSRIAFPRAWLEETCDFSFSGLKTAVLRFMQKDGGATPLEDVSAALQEAVVDVLVAKTMRAARETKVSRLVVAGGVAANRALAAAMARASEEVHLDLTIPPPALCTDNAAMVALSGMRRVQRGENDMPFLDAFASDPLGRRLPTSA